MIIRADARSLPLVDGCVDCVVTSPPYFGLRDYRIAGQIGIERTPADYIAQLRLVFDEVRRVLSDTGTLWLNIGDSYAASGRGGGGGSFQNNALGREMSEVNGFRMPPPGYKQKDLIGIPWMLAFALRDSGWYLRSDIIWSKPNPMPESVTDRPTKAHEYLFLLTKSERYHYDAAAIAEPCSPSMQQQIEQGYEGLGLKDYKAAGAQNPSTVKARIIANAKKRTKGAALDESGDRRDGGRWNSNDGRGFPPSGKHAGTDPQAPGRRMVENVARARAEGGAHEAPFGLTRNRRTVWTITTQPYAGAHFAVMPEALVEPCIRAGCPEGGLVLDPFSGAGTVGVVAEKLQRRYVGVELNADYIDIARKRIAGIALLFNQQTA